MATTERWTDEARQCAEVVCRHCGKRIVRVPFALGEQWMHQPAGASFGDSMTCYCETTVAEPEVTP